MEKVKEDVDAKLANVKNDYKVELYDMNAKVSQVI
jgi:hypothetical protein